MKHFRKIFFALSFFILLGSCRAPKECSRYAGDFNALIQPVIYLTNDSPVLYQASFEVLRYNFSGLIAFRKSVQRDEIRVALISEVGLKFMEFSYYDRQIRNTFCSPAISKKSVPKFIGSFLELLIHQPDCKSVCLYAEGEKSNYFCNAGSKKVFIETVAGDRTAMVLHGAGRKGAKASYIASPEIPDDIAVQMKYRTTITLRKVSNAFK